MATRTLREATGTDLGTAGHFEETALLADNDDFRLVRGSQTVSGTLNQSGIDLASMVLGEDWAGILEGLQIDVNQSGAYLRVLSRAGRFSVSGAINRAELLGAIQTTANGGAWERIYQTSGTFYATAASDPQIMDIVGGSAVIEASSGSDFIDELFISNASVICRRNIDQCVLGENATLTLEESATIADGATTAKITLTSASSRLIIATKGNITIDEVVGKAGLVDPSRATGTVTISNISIGAALDLRRGTTRGEVTISASSKYGPEGYAVRGRR